MPLDNTEYIYQNLPGRYRLADEGQDFLLRRLLQHFGEKFDGYDAAFDSFSTLIAAETATEPWVEFWLNAIFGWSWFPKWFTLADKRRLYGNFAQHNARRGTAKGIQLWLKEFGIVARMHNRPVAYGEFAYGETVFTISEPLYSIIEIMRIDQPPTDASFYDEAAWGELFYAAPERPLEVADILALIEYQRPAAQVFDVIWKVRDYTPTDFTPVWGQSGWVQDEFFETAEW